VVREDAHMEGNGAAGLGRMFCYRESAFKSRGGEGLDGGGVRRERDVLEDGIGACGVGLGFCGWHGGIFEFGYLMMQFMRM